jgi:hypothetical protein
VNSKISVTTVSIVAALVFLLASGSIVGSYYQAFARGHHSYHGHHHSYHGHHSYYDRRGPNGHPGGHKAKDMSNDILQISNDIL